MNSRERILAALNHQPVDRVPIDLGGTRQSGIAALAYSRLRRALGMEGKPPFKVFDLYQQLAELDHEVLERFGADCVGLNRTRVAFGIENTDWKAWQLQDGTDALVPGGFLPETEDDGALVLKRDGEVIARMPKGGFYFDRFEKYPGATHPDLDTWRPPALAEAELEHFHQLSLAYAEQTDRAVVAPLGPPYELFNGMGQGNFEEWIITFATEDEYVKELYEILAGQWIEDLRAFHGAVGDRVQVIQVNDDLGTQRSPFLSTEMFRDKVMPYYKRGMDWIHEHTNWKVLMHTDGAIFPLIPSIIEMGVDFLNPVQFSADGMEGEGLVEAFGGEIGFWGASCDSQGTLGTGTPEEVAEEARRNLDCFRPLNGGFIFASIHNVQANVPEENIIALYDAALNYGG